MQTCYWKTTQMMGGRVRGQSQASKLVDGNDFKIMETVSQMSPFSKQTIAMDDDCVREKRMKITLEPP
ncbi:unnamed protein product [Angiostrongylus costaricensis]|uniref:Uncharacterized protein n=1 Tax=Angiostrongylus costaricensis TaxID=334426 RepID=A0A0R3PK10_ANGCS|nr:unnamed protein product [Angiostrongylus costaricensis]